MTKTVGVMFNNLRLRSTSMLLGAFLAGSIFVSAALALKPQQGNPETAQTAAAPSTVPGTAAVASPIHPHRQRKLASPYRSKGTSIHEQQFYQINWGVDSFAAKTVEAGQMIRFSYRVLDAQKAKALNDKKAAPTLVDDRAHVQLVVPSMEKVGQLRQSSTPEAGRTYWMVFSNKGKIVKHGDHVSVVIGRFHADGLVVD
jgi:hypothetical protein